MDDEDDVEEEAEKLVKESAEMGDDMTPTPPEGETCDRCDRDATWQDPVSKEVFCEEHATDFFEERHS